MQFEEAFYSALPQRGSAEQVASLLWDSALKGEAWAIQLLLQRLVPESKQIKLTHGAEDANAIDYARLTDAKSSNWKDYLAEPQVQIRNLKAERARRNLKEFVIQAWPVLEPQTPFVDGMHIDAICLHLQAVTQQRIPNLLITVPPGHAKSLLTAVFWPTWVWIDHPEVRWLFSSYREALAIRDSLKCRRLIRSDWYQERWGSRYQLRGD